MKKHTIHEAGDIRLEIFQRCMNSLVTAALVVEKPGVLSGVQRACGVMEGLGLRVSTDRKDADPVYTGQEIVRVTGNPLQITRAEDLIIGTLSKSSGVATAASQARRRAGSRCKVVSGGWKKMPVEIKEMLRQAVGDGGLDFRISEPPFIYLDKNYVRILGGVGKAIKTAGRPGHRIIVQVRGEKAPVDEESIAAANAGAEVVMIDTGRREDIPLVSDALRRKGLRLKVQIAFSGNIVLDDIEGICRMDVDILDIGYAILDAPCLPMHFDVVGVAGKDAVKRDVNKEGPREI